MKPLGTVQQAPTALMKQLSTIRHRLVIMARAYDPAASSCGKGHEGLRGQGGPVGTSGRGGYRVPCSYVTDMKPNYVTIYISKHIFENICNGFVTAVAYVTDLSSQDAYFQ